VPRDEGLSTSRGSSPESGDEAWVLRLLGDVTASRDPPEQADGHHRDALALTEEL
jgi:hypothetical protein